MTNIPLKLTQSDLAAQCNVTRSAVSQNCKKRRIIYDDLNGSVCVRHPISQDFFSRNAAYASLVCDPADYYDYAAELKAADIMRQRKTAAEFALRDPRDFDDTPVLDLDAPITFGFRHPGTGAYIPLYTMIFNQDELAETIYHPQGAEISVVGNLDRGMRVRFDGYTDIPVLVAQDLDEDEDIEDEA